MSKGAFADRLAGLKGIGDLNISSARQAAEVQGWLSTGNYALNWAVSGRLTRGYPLGHIVEIYGDEATGKSFLIARALAECMKKGGEALLDDTEGAFNPEWAEKALDVDVSQLAYVRSDTVENHHRLLSGFLQVAAEGKGPYAVALDSVALLTTEHEQSVGLDKPSMVRAKLLHALFRLVGRAMASTPMVYLVANHVYTGPSASPFQPRATAGGRALAYQASVRLDLRTPSKIKNISTKEIRGVKIRVVVSKNRIVAPFREVEIVIPFHRAISPFSGLIPLLLQLNLIEMGKGHRLLVRGKQTRIFAQKNNLLKQETSAQELLDEFPDLIEWVDEQLKRAECD